MINMMYMLFLLIGWHAIADFPLQGEFLALGKNRHTEIGKEWWVIALPAHAWVHGIGVAVITGSVLLGCAEVILHSAIDFAKCEKWISIRQDQAMHVACKIWYLVVIAYFPYGAVG